MPKLGHLSLAAALPKLGPLSLAVAIAAAPPPFPTCQLTAGTGTAAAHRHTGHSNPAPVGVTGHSTRHTDLQRRGLRRRLRRRRLRMPRGAGAAHHSPAADSLAVLPRALNRAVGALRSRWKAAVRRSRGGRTLGGRADSPGIARRTPAVAARRSPGGVGSRGIRREGGRAAPRRHCWNCALGDHLVGW